MSAAVLFNELSRNRKISPVDETPTPSGRPRFTPRAPFACSTYASVEATCIDGCVFKDNGCYATAGYTGIVNARLDAGAVGKTALEVILEEVAAIDGAFGGGPVPQDGACGGRDLRLHVGGDVGGEEGARLLAAAVERWFARGGGSVWVYTHAWRTVPRAAWGRVSVFASVEYPEQIEEAAARGYAAAIVVSHFRSQRAYRLAGSTRKIIPCPAVRGSVTCVDCRLCLDRDVLALGAAIGFELHGRDAGAARVELVQLKLFGRSA